MKSINELSIREKIGQTMIMRVKEIEEMRKNFNSLEEFFEAYPIGGVFIAEGVIKNPENGVEDILQVVREYQKASKIPLIMCGDFEGGCGQNILGMTEFIPSMGLAAAGSEELAYKYGASNTMEVRSLGIHWAFTPVADLQLNPKNNITNVRSAGDDPDKALKILRQVVRGMQENGLSATAKHFPGDGVDWRNQHIVTSHNSLEMEEWRQTYGKVFKTLIDDGLDAIMAGHIALPAYQKERMYGNPLPCTLSKELMTDLLKEQMGFEGVIVSDALVMAGFLEWYERRIDAEVKCLEAGCDMLLWPTIDYLDKAEEAVNNGEILLSRLNDAVERIWRLKEKRDVFCQADYGIKPLSGEQSKEIKNSAAEIAQKSITLVWDKYNQLPLDKNKVRKVLYVAAAVREETQEKLGFVKKCMEDMGIQTDYYKGIKVGQLERIADDYDLIIFGFSVAFGVSDPGAWHSTLASTWSALCYGKSKTIIVSFGSPYIHNDYFRNSPICINAWSHTVEAQGAFVKALFGEISFLGKMPVKI